MRKLYIIGNGFDIAHGLDTSYWNFRTFLEKTDYQFLLEFEKMYNIHPLDETEYGYTLEAQEKWNNLIYDTLWCEFEKSMGFPDIQSMLDFSEIIVNDLDLESGNIGILDTMNEYWARQYGFIKKLQNYVKEWISQIDLNQVKTKKSSLINNQEDYFLNFNYTPVLEKIYKINNVLHIHGSIDGYADNPPFMGHCNQKEISNYLRLYHEAREGFDDGKISIYRAIFEFLSAIYKDTSQYITDNYSFFNSLSSIEEIIIIGWSAGDVDIPYLEKIRDSINQTTKWTVYYYDKKAYTALKNAFSENNVSEHFTTSFIQSNDFWDNDM